MIVRGHESLNALVLGLWQGVTGLIGSGGPVPWGLGPGVCGPGSGGPVPWLRRPGSGGLVPWLRGGQVPWLRGLVLGPGTMAPGARVGGSAGGAEQGRGRVHGGQAVLDLGVGDGPVLLPEVQPQLALVAEVQVAFLTLQRRHGGKHVGGY